MGLPEDLQARVIADGPCPPIPPGPGRVVLTTVNHLNADVRQLTVEDGQGRRESFRPTGFHKFYREGDRTWVSACELSKGNRICGRSGALTVVTNTLVAGVHRVYNLTVEGEHVYQVSSLGVVAHNTACTPGTIRFGNNPNQTSHAFRHVVAAGMDQGVVQAAIQADLAANLGAITAGLNVRPITVAGQNLVYHAFKLPDGVINVGRITLR
jgi:hypothetical protein